MIHFLALLIDLLTDSQFLRGLSQSLFFLGAANSALLLLLSVFRIIRRRKLGRAIPSHARVLTFPLLRRHSS